MLLPQLHPTQEKLLEILKESLGEELTIRDLRDRLRISSPSVVHHHITQLEKKGYLRRNPSNPYDYQILSTTPERKIAYLNSYAMAQCGPNGSIFDGNPLERVPVSTKLLGFRAEDAFLVKAKGTSMIPKIYPGDYVIAQKTSTAKNGDIVVCANDGKVLIKKIQILQNNGGKSIALTSLNEEKFSPFAASRDDFRVEGVVRGIISYNP